MTQGASSFLGVGWAFPPSFSLVTGDAELVADEEDVRQSLQILFGTRMGERIMLPEYGAHLGRSVFRGMTATFAADLRVRITRVVTAFEPRIELVSVDVGVEVSAEGAVDIRLVYQLRGQNSRGNLVFPFYLQEATHADFQP